jgi:hypothetical protein
VRTIRLFYTTWNASAPAALPGFPCCAAVFRCSEGIYRENRHLRASRYLASHCDQRSLPSASLIAEQGKNSRQQGSKNAITGKEQGGHRVALIRYLIIVANLILTIKC